MLLYERLVYIETKYLETVGSMLGKNHPDGGHGKLEGELGIRVGSGVIGGDG